MDGPNRGTNRNQEQTAKDETMDRQPIVQKVYLVGAGPGDPELLTVRALRLLQAADVLVYDNLVSPAILDCVRPEAQRVFVGKRAGRHTLPQEEINALLVELGQAGGVVVRLKGGDPYIFGRGGEEAEALAAAGIPFAVVPGITAACGMAASQGIPLTHRDHAQSCLFVTGHLKDGALLLDWEALARPRQTVVFYMGVSTLPTICRELVAHGLPADTPAAVVRNATLPDAERLVGTLASLPALAAAAELAPPALLVVGEVAALAERLAPRAAAVDQPIPQAT